MQIEIVNWEKFNPRPRGDVKSASWFRCQNNFVTDPDFFDLSNDQKMIWIYLCSTASAKMDASFKINPNLIASLLKIDARLVRSTLEAFENTGLIKSSQRVRSESAAGPHQNTALRTNEHNEHNYSSSAEADPTLLFDLWGSERGSLPEAARFTAKRRKKAATRLAEEPNLEYWSTIIRRLAASPFATGQVKSERCPNGWLASFDWLIENDTNHVKVSEGRYDDSKPKTRKTKIFTKEDV